MKQKTDKFHLLVIHATGVMPVSATFYDVFYDSRGLG